MPIQTKLNGEAELTGHSTKIVFSNGLEKDIFHSDIEGITLYEGKPVLKHDNKYGKEESYWKGIEPVKTTDEYFLYPLSQSSYRKLEKVSSIQQCTVTG